MAGSGVLFALDPGDERIMLGILEPRARAAWVANTIEERWDAAWLHAVETMWFPLHYCLHGASTYPIESSPAEAKAIFGGVPLGVPKVYSIDYKDADLVRRIASALSRMRDDAIWARAGLVDRKDYGGPRHDGLQAAVVDEVHTLAEFYRKASDASRSVIFTLDM